MRRFLRTSSTRRLLAVIAGVIAVVAAGTAIAVAAAGTGPVPARKPLASAIRSALGAPEVQGISARISFTNHLIDASSIQGATDPLLQGASGRLWLSPAQHRLRLELQSDNGDAQIVVDNGTFTVYDPAAKTAYEGTLPAPASHAATAGKPDALPSLAEIQKELTTLAGHLSVSGAIPSDVAGQAAYTVRVSPKHDGGLLGAAELAWDATHGVPLRFAIYARGSNSPVIELKATDITYGAVSPKVFSVSPPPGTKVVKVATQPAQSAAKRTAKGKHHATVSGVAAVAGKLPFALSAPSSLVGLDRHSVTLLDWNHSPAALVTYGKGLGGIAVIEQHGDGTAAAKSSGAGQSQFSLPTVSINGATGQELDTALGTMLRFTRAGVSYIVVGSIPPSAAELAARAL